MKKYRFTSWMVVSALMILALVLGACAQEPAAPEATEPPAQEVPAQEEAEEVAASEEQFSIDNPKGKKPQTWTDEVSDCSSVMKEPPWTIGVSNYSLGNSYRVQMFEELQFAAENDPRIEELIITNADGNLAKQVSDIEDLIARGVDAIMILPLSPEGIAPSVEDAYDAGIATVIFNDVVNTTKFHSTIWVDEYKFGWIGGYWLNEQLGSEGNVVFLDGVAGTATSELRAQGALDALSPNVNVLTRQPADWDYAKGKAAMEDMIAAYPEIDGIYSQGGAMSLGALEALQAAGRDLVPVTGEGYNGFLKFWKENLDNGFQSIGPDEPTWSSVEALNTTTACLEGETVEKWHELPLPVITAENLDNYVRLDCPDDVWSNTKMTPESITELYSCGQ